MATKVEMWQSTAGGLFKTEHEAMRDDLRTLLSASGSIINDASAEKLANWIVDDIDRTSALAKVAQALYNTHPAQPMNSPLMPSACPKCGSTLCDCAPSALAVCDHGIPTDNYCPNCSDNI